MKKLFTILLALNLSIAFGQTTEFSGDDMEFVTSDELASHSITIKEIKSYIATIDTNSTCMDEYLKRRSQLIAGITLAPVTIAASIAIPAVGATFVTSIGLGLIGVDAYAGLAFGLLTGVVSGVTGGVISIKDSNTKIYSLIDVDLILKTLGENYLYQAGKKSEKLYERYSKKHSSPLPYDAFLHDLMGKDATGVLCDGSLVKQPRFKIGSKLKYKVARVKGLQT